MLLCVCVCVCVNTYIQFLSQTFQESVHSMAFSSIVIHPGTMNSIKWCLAFVSLHVLSFGMVSVDLFCKLEGAAIYIFPLLLNKSLRKCFS